MFTDSALYFHIFDSLITALRVSVSLSFMSAEQFPFFVNIKTDLKFAYLLSVLFPWLIIYVNYLSVSITRQRIVVIFTVFRHYYLSVNFFVIHKQQKLPHKIDSKNYPNYYFIYFFHRIYAPFSGYLKSIVSSCFATSLIDFLTFCQRSDLKILNYRSNSKRLFQIVADYF